MLLVTIAGVGSVCLYLTGCYLLGDAPWTFWKTQEPEMYDGKVPYEVWAARMEEARRIQREQENG